MSFWRNMQPTLFPPSAKLSLFAFQKHSVYTFKLSIVLSNALLLEIFTNCQQYKNTNICNLVLIVLLEMNKVNELMQTWNIVLIYPLTCNFTFINIL